MTGLWNPSVGPNLGDVEAQLASVRARLKEEEHLTEWLYASLYADVKRLRAENANLHEILDRTIAATLSPEEDDE